MSAPLRWVAVDKSSSIQGFTKKCKMKGNLLGMFLLFKCCICENVRSLDGDIKNFVVSNNSLFVLTNNHLNQMRHNLTMEKIKDYIGTQANPVTLLVPFQANGTLITCGPSDGGYCEVLDLNDIANSIYLESRSSLSEQNEKSVAFIVDTSKSGAYILVGMKEGSGNPPFCIVTLWNTLHSQTGSIFSKIGAGSSPCIQTNREVEFIDGFQITSRRLSYLFLNAKTETGWQAYVLTLINSKSKKNDIIKDFKGSRLECCKDAARPVLLASALIPSDKAVLWTGVFSAQKKSDPENTALAVYDISKVDGKVGGICSSIANPQCSEELQSEERIQPLEVVFKYKSMSSVTAVRDGSWIVLFIGTEDGQLIKLVLDEKFSPGCPIVLYRSDVDQEVFPKMQLDPVDSKYIYIALKNQIRRVPMVQCDKYNSLGDCRASLDPFCGWCTNVCSSKNECLNSSWVSFPKDSIQKRLLSFQVTKTSSGKINLHLSLSLESTQTPAFTCAFKAGGVNLCDTPDPAAVFPNCSCSITDNRLSTGGLEVLATVTIEDQKITDTLMLKNCSSITDNSPNASYTQCVQCITVGCHWSSSEKRCDWLRGPEAQFHVQDVCKDDYKEPKITSIEPNTVSFHGRNNVLLNGSNLESVTKIRIYQGDLGCISKQSPVFDRSSDSLRFHIPPSGNKGIANVCAVTQDGRCHGTSIITYSSQPSCTDKQPKVTWKSGGRMIYIQGTNMEFVESTSLESSNKELKTPCNTSSGGIWLRTQPYDGSGPQNLTLKVGNSTLNCANLMYHPDPVFTKITSSKLSGNLQVTIEMNAENLNLSRNEVKVFGLKDEESYVCFLVDVKSTIITCEIKGTERTVDSVTINFGDFSKTLEITPNNSNLLYLYILAALILLIILGSVVGVVFHRRSQKQMNEKMNNELEKLEMGIRRDIRQGFVDLQTEKSDLIENVGAIPFLDYKHFASRIFFPEGGQQASKDMIKDIGQDSELTMMDEKCQAFATLIRNKQFLTCFVHALEEHKDFSIKDKCSVASLLTLALHGDLIYLTEIMEDLLQSLMDQSSNTNPKLMLRRTESIVEKLLTNWMSICLYGFLRESVGQPLFLLVSALTQQISKGPVDSVTEKALYTLNEDWLLCQAQDFEAVKLKVLFAVGTDGEVSEVLEVNALTCDSIHQVKEKILQTFQRKFGFQYTQNIRDIEIEYEKAGSFIMLQEVDDTSEVRGHVTMLNTLKHYQVTDGACIKVLTKRFHAPLRSQSSVKGRQGLLCQVLPSGSRH
ncbi:Plexin-C1 Virus-encoded semaphorin protein receptor [Triplophysa tibetana]|uniref:Plexin-C1 Virus-encoded semaphorin protein receptor n=1 Tax=Triplophysa tibetana TaxID=1572043 RepID=A0A5A9PH21_9TELE|nr:Plexin-C1 Virus-encoded semaphorin protein receptor [Triplophysa tibetana]